MARAKKFSELKRAKTAKKFANLYVHGPTGMAGEWETCENAVGEKFAIDDPYIRDAIIAEGGTIASNPATPELAALDKKMVVAESKEQGWIALAKELEPTYLAIAKGDVKASAAQAALIRNVYDRAYGKVAALQTEKLIPSAVVVLPTLGERSNQFLCPKCGLEHEIEYSEEVKKDGTSTSSA